MDESLAFFDEAARVGAEIRDALAAQPPSHDARYYLARMAEISSLLVSIHEIVADAAIGASMATSLDEARLAISAVDHDSLEFTFRARDWCDKLQSLGQALRPLQDLVTLPLGDKQIWGEFCQALEDREGEVARLYYSKLYVFHMLAYSNLPLEDIKSQAREILDQLAIQQARFNLLAKTAQTLRLQQL